MTSTKLESRTKIQSFSEDYMVALWQRMCRVLGKAAVTR